MRTNQNNGWKWDEIRRDYLRRHPHCEARQYGCLVDATDVHHIIARVDEGGDDEDNLMSLCGPCHDRETQKLKARLAKERKKKKDDERRNRHPGIKPE